MLLHFAQSWFSFFFTFLRGDWGWLWHFLSLSEIFEKYLKTSLWQRVINNVKRNSAKKEWFCYIFSLKLSDIKLEIEIVKTTPNFHVKKNWNGVVTSGHVAVAVYFLYSWNNSCNLYILLKDKFFKDNAFEVNSPIITKPVREKPASSLKGNLKRFIDNKDRPLRKARKTKRDNDWDTYRCARNKRNAKSRKINSGMLWKRCFPPNKKYQPAEQQRNLKIKLSQMNSRSTLGMQSQSWSRKLSLFKTTYGDIIPEELIEQLRPSAFHTNRGVLLESNWNLWKEKRLLGLMIYHREWSRTFTKKSWSR